MTKDKALDLALEALEELQPDDAYPYSLQSKAITAIKQARSAPVQEPVACAVCNEVHAILDADESKIIRDAKDGYPDGRTPRILTLQERVTALCVYASDWKRWCLEKENTTPPAAQPAVPLTRDELRAMWINRNTCWDFYVGVDERLFGRSAAPEKGQP